MLGEVQRGQCLFFRRTGHDGSDRSDQHSQSGDYKRLFKSACKLIEAGHPNVLDYGYSFFVDALNEHEYIKYEKLKDTAYAFRVAQFADEKTWRNFLRRKG